MAYGSIKVDTIVFTNNSADQSVSISGIIASTSGDLTVTGTISGSTVQATYGTFTNLTGVTTTGTTANFVTLSGTTVTGITANFVTVSGATVTGTTAQFTSITGNTAGFTTVTGTTVTGTTANFVTVSGTTTTGTTANFASGVFTTQVSGATIIAPTGTFTSLTGTTTTGTTANFVSGVFSTQVSGVTITGTTVATTTGTFVSLTGTTATFTSGIIASGTAALPSLAILSDPNTGIFSPGADQLAISTNGVARLTTSTTAVSSSLAVDHPLGAEATPSITFTGDLNTGFYSPAADTLAAVTAGSNRLHITSGGLVGIGTSNAKGTLTLQHGNTSPQGLTDVAIDALHISQGVGGTVAIRATQYDSVNQAAAGDTQFFNLYFNGSTYNYYERMRITAEGRVGIGSTAPLGKLGVGENGNSIVLDNIYSEISPPTTGNDSYIFRSNNDGSLQFSSRPGAGGRGYRFWRGANITLFNDENGTTTLTSAAATAPFIAKISTTEAARIDSSGRLLVGTSTARDNYFGAGSGQSLQFQIEGTDYKNSCASFTSNSTNAESGPHLAFGRSRGAAVDSNTLVNNGDTLGVVVFHGNDGSKFVQGARIDAEVDGTPGANDMPGRLVFSTTPDGGSSPTSSPPAMTIKSSQEVLIGTSTITANGGILQLKSGITFPATPVAATDVNTLDDYEEGTWSVVDRSGAGLTLTTNASIYIKIGKLVYCHADVTFPSTASATSIGLSLPFVPDGVQYAQGGTVIRNNKSLVCSTFTVPDSGGSTIFLTSGLYTTYETNADMSSGTCNFSMTYQTS